jgi:hypothetical protein
MGIIVIALIINAIISAVVASAAKSRQIGSTSAFWISFLLTPILGMFMVAMSPQLTSEEMKSSIQQSEYDVSKLGLLGLIFLIGIIIVCFG